VSIVFGAITLTITPSTSTSCASDAVNVAILESPPADAIDGRTLPRALSFKVQFSQIAAVLCD
jgi:hypothetical protein